MVTQFRFRLWIGIIVSFSVILLISVLSFFYLRNTTPVDSDKHAAHLSNHPAMVKPPQNNTLTIDPKQMKAIGITFTQVKKHLLNKTIRTVGHVTADERKTVSITIKVGGWIEKLFVNSTGEYIKKGQPLFAIYSPELVATEQEYLLALQAAKKLKHSPYAEISENSASLLKVTHRRLQLWDITDEQIQALNKTGQVSKTLIIHSPITGTVIKKIALEGMKIVPGDHLYTIADLSHIWILADIYENELPEVHVGQTATVTLPYTPNTTLQGRVSFIYPTVNQKSRTVKARLEFANPKDLLKPDMYVNVKLNIPLGLRLAVPADAVLESGERSLVFIYLGDGKLVWRNVKTGVKTEGWIEILDGVKEGEPIVSSANFLIDSESQLKAAIGHRQH